MSIGAVRDDGGGISDRTKSGSGGGPRRDDGPAPPAFEGGGVVEGRDGNGVTLRGGGLAACAPCAPSFGTTTAGIDISDVDARIRASRNADARSTSVFERASRRVKRSVSPGSPACALSL